MKPSILSIPLFLLSAADYASAVHFNIRGRPRTRRLSSDTLGRRANVTGTSSVSDVSDVQYDTDITLGGQSFTVQIDTGSSDLWVSGSVSNAKSTGKSTQVTYAVGEVEGSVKTAELVFAGYTVSDQAFIQVSEDSESNDGSDGLIGLGPNSGSQVLEAIGTSAGDAVLDRIFKQNTTTPNYITILLGRINDPTTSPTGELTVGEIISGHENITSQPKLDVSVLSSSNDVNQHWQILLDEDGIIGPAGEDVISELNIKTGVSTTSNSKQLTVVIDTGYSLPQVPSAVAEAFYKDVPDAQLVSRSDLAGDIWQIPCDKEVNITFKFGGVSFPIHPLDANIDLNATDSSGNHVCFGAFQPISSESDTYDAIFGMAFLRNAYTYINFGDFVDGSTSTTADPYVQLLPLSTNASERHSDFLAVRGNSPWSPTGASLGERIRAHLGLVIGIAVAAGVLLIAAIAGCCVYSRRKQRKTVFFQATQPYQQLHEPAPEAYDMHAVPGQHGAAYQGGPVPPAASGQQGFRPGYNPGYSNPWDARY